MVLYRPGLNSGPPGRLWGSDPCAGLPIGPQAVAKSYGQVVVGPGLALLTAGFFFEFLELPSCQQMAVQGLDQP